MKYFLNSFKCKFVLVYFVKDIIWLGGENLDVIDIVCSCV